VLIEHILQRKGNEVVTITTAEPVTRALEALREHNIGALVVTADDGDVEGIISERDVVRALADEGASALHRPVSDLMSTDLATCGPRATTHELMVLMTERRIRHIPVVDKDGLAGLVSIGDIVKSRIGELEDERQTLHDYLAGRS
jgi:CBS domain-containing protein